MNGCLEFLNAFRDATSARRVKPEAARTCHSSILLDCYFPSSNSASQGVDAGLTPLPTRPGAAGTQVQQRRPLLTLCWPTMAAPTPRLAGAVWVAVALTASLAVSPGDDTLPTPASLPEKRGKFGFVGEPFLKVEEVEGFPSTADFFDSYVFKSKPLIMRGAAKASPAFELWQKDDYFLGLEIPEDEFVTVETMKKENRTQEVLDLNFREFIETYKEADTYMVHRVPEYLGPDVIVPHPLQCPDLYERSIVEAIMWFSGGGTKSVVHTDSVDNMNCVYDGDKFFVMVDPKKYAEKVFFDHPEGAYSDIDVDNVDYEKYKGLLSVEYYHVTLKAGDCLFIPYKWIHQVRSAGPRNVAINIWWDTYRNDRVDRARCAPVPDPRLTLDKISFIGFGEVLQSVNAVRDQFLDFTRHMNLTWDKFVSINTGPRDPDMLGSGIGYTLPLKQIFSILDSDGDGLMTQGEVKKVTDADWRRVQKQQERFDAVMEALEERWERDRQEEEEQGEETWRERDEL